LTDSLTKTKILDPFILSLVKNIGRKRSFLDDLECIDIDPAFHNIVSDNIGSEFYIENELHKAKGFRKLHLEIAEFSGNLKILHCVFFPEPTFNLPIFGLDLVKVKNVVSAAIVDLSPVSKNNYKFDKLLDGIDKSQFSIKREVPSWGNIFSRNVFFASLKDDKEQNSFYEIVDQYLSVLIESSQNITPDLEREVINERTIYQKRYCAQQLKNEKTSSVLLKYFEKDWVDRYMKEILFDF
tara:strand:- start:148 stop:867 length:720 start_codon:yes stop_codon:yes gene_type:complete